MRKDYLDLFQVYTQGPRYHSDPERYQIMAAARQPENTKQQAQREIPGNYEIEAHSVWDNDRGTRHS